MIDDSILFIKEIQTAGFEKYSYHWQKKSGDLILRYDNSPYHNELKTFPHHKHIDNNVVPRHRIAIEELIEEIRNFVSKPV